MRKRMTKREIQAFQKRWQAINDLERSELRAASPDLKFRQVAALMASVDPLGWRGALEEGVEEIRKRWQRLRRFYGV